uniref:Uncharacterized protein n=1 Tax=uncultured marine virus TaxID=186617 RepID=A0A0F7L3R4_9VIRU|nr:hypothetical protein [uncultured marine virus]
MGGHGWIYCGCEYRSDGHRWHDCYPTPRVPDRWRSARDEHGPSRRRRAGRGGCPEPCRC